MSGLFTLLTIDIDDDDMKNARIIEMIYAVRCQDLFPFHPCLLIVVQCFFFRSHAWKDNLKRALTLLDFISFKFILF